jgi:uncharacterized integral membrane protein
MRLVFPVMLIMLGVVLVGFLIMNPAERVNITVGSSQYEDVPLSLVALIALTIGVAFTATVALIEGAAIRLTNRRLRREIQRLETENSFLRSQSQESPPAALEPEPIAALPTPVEDMYEESLPPRPASAPVYDPD